MKSLFGQISEQQSLV